MEPNDEILQRYEESFFVSTPKAQTHPVHLATLAMLFGMDPPAPGTSRVLEIGCGTGTNLLAIARDLPRASCTGVDLSPAQIEAGQALASKQSLGNVQLIARSITEMTRESGQFDFIICHGVFSWVPDFVRQAILRICRENLSPQGVAYISYNAFPGRRAFEAVREMMLYHTARCSGVDERIRRAREIVALAVEPGPHNRNVDSTLIDEARLAAAAHDTMILHDYLATFSQAFYFTQFIEMAQEAGLQYLSDSNPGSMILSMLGPKVEALVRENAADLIEAEQYMDFMRNRRFRETLLCHSEIAVDRRFDARRTSRMYVQSALRPRAIDPVVTDTTPVEFELSESNRFTATSPLTKVALLALSTAHPKQLHFAELAQAGRNRLGSLGIAVANADVDRLANDLFDAFLANLLQLRCEPVAAFND